MRLRQLVLAVVLALAGVRSASAVGALVQSRVSSATAASPITLAFTSNTTATNLLVVMSSTDATVVNVTDSGGNSYARCGIERNTGFAFGNLWYAMNATGGADTVTVTFTGGNNGGMVVAEYSGMVTSGACDANTGATGFGTAVSTGATGVTAQAAEVGVCMVAKENTATTSAWGSSYIEEQDRSAVSGISFADKILSVTGAQTCTTTMSGSQNWAAVVATFKASAGAATTPCFRTLLGVGCDVDARPFAIARSGLRH